MIRSIMKVLCAVVLLNLFVAAFGCAGNNSWTNIGPDSGITINALAIDPVVHQTLYAGTNGGVFKSTDGGNNWRDFNAGLTNTQANDLAIMQTAPQTLYAGTSSGIWSLSLPPSPTNAITSKSADFDGDGLADIAVYRQTLGLWSILMTSNGYNSASALNVFWGNPILADRPVPGDFDGDGKTDIAVYRPSTEEWLILTSSTGYNYNNRIQIFWGNPSLNDQPVVGDFDGDGKADIAVYRSTTGEWLILLSSSGYSYNNAIAITWGNLSFSDQPVLGDFDGDGKTDIAVYRPTTGEWLILTSSTGYSYNNRIQVFWGNPNLNDQPRVGDYDGDGKSDIAVWRAGTGQWFALKSSGGYSYDDYLSATWGNSSLDEPVPGDFDGDHKADAAVYRLASGSWFILRSSSGYINYQVINWGTPELGDMPLGFMPVGANLQIPFAPSPPADESDGT
jgi:hypothetical protein